MLKTKSSKLKETSQTTTYLTEMCQNLQIDCPEDANNYSLPSEL